MLKVILNTCRIDGREFSRCLTTHVVIGKSADAVAQVLLITIVVVRVDPHRNRHQRSKEPAQEHWTSDDRVLQLKFPKEMFYIRNKLVFYAPQNLSLQDISAKLKNARF